MLRHCRFSEGRDLDFRNLSPLTCPLAPLVERGTVSGSSRALHIGLGESRLESRPIGFVVDDEVVGVAREANDRALGADGIGKRGEPFVRSAVRSDDDGVGAVALEDREAVQRGTRDLDALPHRQLANLGESETVAEPALDHRALLNTPHPPIATLSAPSGMQREEHLTDVLVADRGAHLDAGSRGRLKIAADGLRIEPELGGDALLRQARACRRTPPAKLRYLPSLRSDVPGHEPAGRPRARTA